MFAFSNVVMTVELLIEGCLCHQAVSLRSTTHCSFRECVQRRWVRSPPSPIKFWFGLTIRWYMLPRNRKAVVISWLAWRSGELV